MFEFKDLHTVHLEITSRCQASCPMCPRNYHGGIENPNLVLADWTIEDFKKIFDHETLDKLGSLYFCGNFGDPMLNNDLIKMCRYVKDHDSTKCIHIHTNGGARNASWWKELREALPDNHSVVFALDGLEDTHHLYRIGTKYETVIQNAKTFIDAGGSAEWVFIKFKHNEHQVEEAERRSIELGFKKFSVKNTVRFIGETRFSVLDKQGEHQYYLEPPTQLEVTLIDATAITNFKSHYKESKIDCIVLKTKEVYIDAHKNVYPCCYLASAPYNNTRSHLSVFEIRQTMLDQYHDLIDNLGGINNINAIKRSLKEIIDSKEWQTVWQEYWGEKMLMTCARVCGTSDKLTFSKPVNQIVKKSSNV